MKIVLNITERFFPCIAKFKDNYGYIREMDSFKLNRISGKRIYITPIKDGMKITEIAKNMILENGIISIKQDDKIISIGTYEEIA